MGQRLSVEETNALKAEQQLHRRRESPVLSSNRGFWEGQAADLDRELAAAATTEGGPAGWPTTLRLVTFNVWKEDLLHAQRWRSLLREAVHQDPQVICLQEVTTELRSVLPPSPPGLAPALASRGSPSAAAAAAQPLSRAPLPLLRRAPVLCPRALLHGAGACCAAPRS